MLTIKNKHHILRGGENDSKEIPAEIFQLMGKEVGDQRCSESLSNFTINKERMVHPS